MALIAVLLHLALASAAAAHELRPAYLALQEEAPGQYAVLWKVPARGDKRLGLYVDLPDSCKAKAAPAAVIEGAAYLERWTARCSPSLAGQTLAVEGLSATLTDVLIRIAYLDGATEIARLTPDAPAYRVAGHQGAWQVALPYFLLGVDHILMGYDHLLFVFALILLIHDRWMLLKTVTAFTLAHSVTLAGAALGYFSLPQAPVEATIALSIAFVARELVQTRDGSRRFSERFPWVVALLFGLLHGFGFAGALQQTGLPQTDIPLALLAFNLGVEAGQLVFVLCVLILLALLRAATPIPARPARLAASYVIGAVAMVWLVERLAGFTGAA